MSTPFEVKQFIDPHRAMKDVAIQSNDLQSSFMDQAGLFAYYGAKHAEAEKQLGRAEHFLKITEARVSKAVRRLMKDRKEKTTEGEIAAVVATHAEVRAAHEALIEAQHQVNVTKSTVEAFRHRRDMLVQIGADAREERKGAVRTMDHKSLSSRAQSLLDTQSNG